MMLRKRLGDYYEDMIEDVVRVHTDGFYIKVESNETELLFETSKKNW